MKHHPYLRRLRNRRGEGEIESLVLVLVCCSLFIVLIYLIGIGVTYSKEAAFANRVVESAAVNGKIDTDQQDYISMAQSEGLNTSKLSFSWDAQYFDEGAGELAFRQPFTFSVSYAYGVPMIFSGATGFTINIPVKGHGTAEVYWK